MEQQFELPGSGVFSASMAAQWARSGTDFYDRYFLRKEKGESPYLKLGKEIDYALGQLALTGDLDTTIPHLEEIASKVIQFNNPQVELKGELSAGLPFIAYLDGAEADFSKFVDHKVSSKPWTQEKAEDSFQMKFYSLYIYRTYGILPIGYISNVLASVSGGGAILEPTGEVLNFEIQYTPEQLDQWEAEARQIAGEVTGAYRVFKNPNLIPLEEIKSYFEVHELEKEAKKKKDKLKKEITKSLDGLNLNKVVLETMNLYSLTRERMVYTSKEAESVVKERKQQLMDTAIEEGLIAPEESVSWYFTSRKTNK